jgi:inner membrane protein involved in colicin E2 resistance
MVMPERLQPGELAAQLSFTAPISLLFFFLVIALLAKLEGLDVHPVNYMFLAASFFSFHLLFAYTVDRIPLGLAFALASGVSVVMVTTYLRLVVSAKFGFLKAGVAQLVYLVGFSAAHFLEGFTGLTVTVLSIATLFLCMLLTGRVRWSEALATPAPASPPLGPYRQGEAAHATAP